ncbi:MAG: glutamine--fructose-6-phosphate transaminase (isomerizing) [Pseudomonadota bacterium]
MCGIIGIVGREAVAPRLLEGLQQLEYRGYDSAGLSTLVDGRIERRRTKGKLVNLKNVVGNNPLPGVLGIGHTRWATHGVPNETNAHPHCNDNVSLVHNGIIENHDEIRQELIALGYTFVSDTDTEVLVHLIDSYLQKSSSPQQAVQQTLQKVEGAYALAILFGGYNDLLIGARRGSPLAVGYGEGEMYLGSDQLALMPLTQRVSYLEEGDLAVLTSESVQIFDATGQLVERPVHEKASENIVLSKGNFQHFMLKEIHEQPEVIRQTLASLLNEEHDAIALPDLPFAIKSVPKITLIACGTAYYACMVAKYWFEEMAQIPVEVDLASEFRYRKPPLQEGGLAIFISQSGETADTLAAHHYAKKGGQHTLAVVNVAESSLARAVDVVLQTLAGPEIGVASTKAFTTQLSVLACLALAWGVERGTITKAEEKRLCAVLAQLPEAVRRALKVEEAIQQSALSLSRARDVLYLGRGTSYPLALEGALKLKEISYIHAEGYAAGEMKHGPIALIDDQVPVIVIAPHDRFFDKTLSNLKEVIARDGPVTLITDQEGCAKVTDTQVTPIVLEDADPYITPIVYAVPIQLLAYHTALRKGTDIDQPRNLAKSVTVE